MRDRKPWDADAQLGAALRLLAAHEHVRQAAVRVLIAPSEKRRDELLLALEYVDRQLCDEIARKREQERG